MTLNLSKKTAGGLSQRQRRVAEILRHALAEIFSRKNFKNPLLNEMRLTLTEVKMSPDLKVASAYFVFSETALDPQEILKLLKACKGEIRYQLTPLISLKFVPELQFWYDNSLEYADRISSLLQRPQVVKDLQSE